MFSKRAINYKCHKKIKCVHQEALRRTYIIKCAADNKLYLFTEYDSSNMDENTKKNAKINIQLLNQLEHPNILKTKAFYETKNAKVCIVTNYIPGRFIVNSHDYVFLGESLSDKIKAQKDQFFDEDQILDWFTQICLTLKYFHSKNILFRSLCTQNFLVTSANAIKVRDIAISRLLSHDQEQVMPYQAPEAIDTYRYDSKSDIWSLGVVLYELCALSRPFKGDSLMDLAYFGILVGKYEPIPIRFSKEMSDLVTSLLQVQSEKRPRIEAVLENPMIKERIEQFSTENIKSREDLYESVRKQVIAC